MPTTRGTPVLPRPKQNHHHHHQTNLNGNHHAADPASIFINYKSFNSTIKGNIFNNVLAIMPSSIDG